MDKRAFSGSFEDAWRRQVLAGLSVSPIERLRWLEQAFDFAAKVGARPRRQLIDEHDKNRNGS